MSELILTAPARADNDRTEGECRRDRALGLLAANRAALVRRLQRGFVRHLLERGPATSDALRAAVPVPAGIDPRVVGAAVRGLAMTRVVVSVGRRRSRRAEAHARTLEVWSIPDRTAALGWLADHPEPTLFPCD